MIGLLATPATVRRTYTNDLIASFASHLRVVRHGSTALVAAAEAKLRGEPVDAEALRTDLAELFDAPGGAEIDVVALACTHFPLLLEELAAAAPRSCLWLDSGDAIARRLANVLILPAGQVRTRRAGFTDAPGAASLAAAFEARGFSVTASISPAPDFEAAPVTDIASA
ncbi:MAG: hypothetical protein WDM79_06775 [Terricaulis sp.]